MHRPNAKKKSKRLFLLLAALSLGLGDFMLHGWLTQPGRAAGLPPSVLSWVRTMYLLGYRHLAQVQCTQYDEELLYVLRPNPCRFYNTEFSTTIQANSKGLRDTEEALAGPDFIVLGDSYAMGWGVEQNQSFPKVLERRIGSRVLNAGISSYGTVRENLMLRRLDQSRLRGIVLQYSDNDVDENRSFVEHQFKHVSSPHSAFVGLQNISAVERYVPFRALWKLAEAGNWRFHDSPRNRASIAKDVDYFLGTINHMSWPKVPIYLIVVSPRDAAFIDEFHSVLEAKLREAPNQVMAAQLRPLSLSPLLREDNYFVLDDHWTARTHALVADFLAAAIL